MHRDAGCSGALRIATQDTLLHSAALRNTYRVLCMLDILCIAMHAAVCLRSMLRYAHVRIHAQCSVGMQRTVVRMLFPILHAMQCISVLMHSTADTLVYYATSVCIHA